MSSDQKHIKQGIYQRYPSCCSPHCIQRVSLNLSLRHNSAPFPASHSHTSAKETEIMLFTTAIAGKEDWRGLLAGSPAGDLLQDTRCVFTDPRTPQHQKVVALHPVPWALPTACPSISCMTSQSPGQPASQLISTTMWTAVGQ